MGDRLGTPDAVGIFAPLFWCRRRSNMTNYKTLMKYFLLRPITWHMEIIIFKFMKFFISSINNYFSCPRTDRYLDSAVIGPGARFRYELLCQLVQTIFAIYASTRAFDSSICNGCHGEHLPSARPPPPPGAVRPGGGWMQRLT